MSNLTAFPPIGQSIYHSGSVDLIRRLTRGLYIRGNYTFARNIDNATNELFSSRDARVGQVKLQAQPTLLWVLAAAQEA